jgi:anti-sigma regulatory factor (Ser/Thr protein kinase)
VGRAVVVNASRDRGAEAPGPAVLALPPELHSVRAARRFVREQCRLAELPRDRCEDALLLTSELVTNAVLHGRSEVCIEVTPFRGWLRIAVGDENSRRPAPVPQDPDALDGRGLALVSALAARWGVDDRPMGKAVWFELELS